MASWRRLLAKRSFKKLLAVLSQFSLSGLGAHQSVSCTKNWSEMKPFGVLGFRQHLVDGQLLWFQEASSPYEPTPIIRLTRR